MALGVMCVAILTEDAGVIGSSLSVFVNIGRPGGALVHDLAFMRSRLKRIFCLRSSSSSLRYIISE